MNIALLQTDIIEGNLGANLAAAEKLFPSEADLVALPEMFSCGFGANMLAQKQSDSQTTLDWMRQMAAKHHCHVCGSLPWHEGERAFNRLFCVSPEGETHHYDKRHLFSMGNEHNQFEAGTEQVVVNIGGARVMLLVCYDLRFPVWSRNRGHYDVALYVANWPTARRHVWTTLLRARAIENQCYVLGVNRVGVGSGVAYSGQTAVFGPRGEVLAEAETSEPETICASLDIGALQNLRNHFGVLADADDFEIKK